MKSVIKAETEAEITYATTLNQYIIDAKVDIGNQVINLGKYFKEMRDGKLYRHLDCESFHEYLAQPEIGFKRSTAYNFIRFYELYVLTLGIDPHLLSNIGHGRLLTIAPVVEENPGGWLEKAESLSTSDLINEVREARGKKPMDKEKKEEVSNPLDVSAGYLEYVTQSPCCVCGKQPPSERAHFPRTRKRGAKEDAVIPLCTQCHRMQGDMGIHSFFKLYGNNIFEWIYQTIRRLYRELGKDKMDRISGRDTSIDRIDVGNDYADTQQDAIGGKSEAE